MYLDVCIVLCIDPLNIYKNCLLNIFLSAYTSVDTKEFYKFYSKFICL